MDNSIININVLMCKKTDENITCIENIFDTLGLENKRLSFDIVTIINSLNFTEKKFTLIYTIEKINDNKRNQAMLLDIKELTSDRSLYDNDEKQSHSIKSSMQNTGQSMFSEHYRNIEFIGSGYYELQVHMIPDGADFLKNRDSNFVDKLCSEKQYIRCVYGFEVIMEV